ncbi:hypothetical protein [Bacillus badius]|nr:hypothetical protein [Bacillus badius]
MIERRPVGKAKEKPSGLNPVKKNDSLDKPSLTTIKPGSGGVKPKK